MIELKEHNIEPYKRLCKALDENDKVGYESATGTGKSFVGSKYVEEHGLENQTLILVPSDVIRDGWRKLLPGVKIVTYQSVAKNEPDMSQYSLLICDELHRLGAETWGAAYQKMIKGFNGKIIGMSATPVRFLDKNRDMIEEMFDGNRIVGVELPDAIRQGILPSFDYIAALYDLGSAKPKDNGRRSELTEKLYGQLNIMENEYSFQNIIRKHLKPGIHKTVVFVPSIDQMTEYMNVVKAVYPDALHIFAHSRMPESAKVLAFQTFEHADSTSFIYTVDMLNEGGHIKGVDTVVMFRKTESPNVFLQQLGRGLDANKGGDRIMVFDFVANHANIHAAGEAAGSVVDWINEGIGDSRRQVIKVDYAKTEIEVLEELRNLLCDKWTEEEDEIVRTHCKDDDYITVLSNLLPDRTWNSIQHRIRVLGFGRKNAVYPENFYEVMLAVYPEEGSKGILERYPYLSMEQVLSYAKKRKIKVKRRGFATNWTDEETEIILNNSEMTPAELKFLLPGKTSHQITNKRSALGIAKKKSVSWTKEEDSLICSNAEISASRIHELYVPNKTISQISERRRLLLGKTSKTERWSPSEDEILRENADVSDKDLTCLLPGRTKNAIRNRRKEIGIPGWSGLKFVAWTDQETAVLRQCVDSLERFGKEEYEEISSLLPNRSLASVRGKFYEIKGSVNKEAENAGIRY